MDSDHFTEYMDLDLKILKEKPERVEIYNFKDENSKVKFKTLTSETDEFTECFADNKPLLDQIEKWQQILKKFCNQSFKKIRIRKKHIKPPKQPLGRLIDERNDLLRKIETPEIKAKLEEVTKTIFKLEAEENHNNIVKNFKKFSDNPENVNLHQVWKLMKKIWPKSASTVPVAKKNHKGKIVSGPNDLTNLLATEYRDRLRSRPVRPDLKA